MRNSFLTVLLCSAMAATGAAQTDVRPEHDPQSSSPQNQQNIQVTPMSQTPVYRVYVVERTTHAVDYRHRAGSTMVQMRGTELAPQIKGDAKVESKAGRLEIDTKLEKMSRPETYGPLFLTYVLWGITPESRPVNLGEVLPDNNGNVKLHSTTPLQSFGLIVTAEPYFAVTRPSNLVVAENYVTYKTKGWEQPIDAKFEALDRDAYAVNVNVSELPASMADRKKVPLELLEARNAVAIAKASGAEHYAPQASQKAEDYLAKGEDYLRRKQGRSAIGTVARYAAQQAEDARVLSIRLKQQEQAENERRQLQEREATARQKAEDEADRARLAREQAEQAQQQQQQAEQAKSEAQQAAQQAAQERAAAEQAREQALAEQQNLRQQVLQAQSQAQQAELQREQTRQQLLSQLNQVLQTKDTARGLIVNMSDVLFDFNKATLKPGARERLARVAGIVLAYPDLHLQIEGHTDNIGSDAYNMQLSDKRAEVVREYLISQGVNANNATAHGFGKRDPVASNDTAAGRQMNRRVELVVSGQAIQANERVPGSPAGTPGTAASGTTSSTTSTGYSSQSDTTVNSSGSAYSQPATAQPSTTLPISQPATSAPMGNTQQPGTPTPQPPPPATTPPSNPTPPQQ